MNIADAIYVFDIACEIVDSPAINMGTGFLDMHLDPRSLIVPAAHPPTRATPSSWPTPFDEHGRPIRSIRGPCSAPGRAVPRARLRSRSSPPSWSAICAHPAGSRPTARAVQLAHRRARAWSDCVTHMRHALLGCGIPLESSNPEYGPGQLEINFGPADPMTTADNTVLFKTIVKQVAVQHGPRASFMPKPWTDQSRAPACTSIPAWSRDGRDAVRTRTRDGRAQRAHGPLDRRPAGPRHRRCRCRHPDAQRLSPCRPYTFCPHPRALGRGQPHRCWPAHHERRQCQPGRVPLGRRRRQPLPGHCRRAGRRLRRHRAAAWHSADAPPATCTPNPATAPCCPPTMHAAIEAFEDQRAGQLGPELAENLVVLARNELRPRRRCVWRGDPELSASGNGSATWSTRDHRPAGDADLAWPIDRHRQPRGLRAAASPTSLRRCCASTTRCTGTRGTALGAGSGRSPRHDDLYDASPATGTRSPASSTSTCGTSRRRHKEARRSIIETDGPAHTRLRRLVTRRSRCGGCPTTKPHAGDRHRTARRGGRRRRCRSGAGAGRAAAHPGDRRRSSACRRATPTTMVHLSNQLVEGTSRRVLDPHAYGNTTPLGAAAVQQPCRPRPVRVRKGAGRRAASRPARRSGLNAGARRGRRRPADRRRVLQLLPAAGVRRQRDHAHRDLQRAAGVHGPPRPTVAPARRPDH